MRGRRLPHELCDHIIGYVPSTHLSSCSLVCKSWDHTASTRLLRYLVLPPKKLEEGEGSEPFVYIVDTLAVSPRFQRTICALRLEPIRLYNENGAQSDLKISTLVAIIAACPNLNDLTISRYILQPTLPAFADGHCGHIKTLTFDLCTKANVNNATGVLQALSLFSHIDTLKIEVGYNVIVPAVNPATPVSASLTIGCIEVYRTRPGFGLAIPPAIQHICTAPGLRDSLRTFRCRGPLYGGLVKSLEGTKVEHISYASQASKPRSFSTLSSLRQLTLHAHDPIELELNWAAAIRDILTIPRTVERITIRGNDHCATNELDRETYALAWMKSKLMNEDWSSLGSLLESRPSMRCLQLCISCTHSSTRWRAEAWQEVRTERVVEMLREVVSTQLSIRVAQRVIVVPTSSE